MNSKLPNSDFTYSDEFSVNDEVLEAFNENGYIILRGLLSSPEVSRLKAAMEAPNGVMDQEKHYLSDGSGKQVRFSQWRHPGNDMTGYIARADKVVTTFEKLLGAELYHYHGKVISKEPRTGGKHVWHQDYGYWYQFGCMYPDMGTVWMAVDKADRENGCVQLLSGSHKLGRLEHGKVGDQAGADEDRVQHAINIGCPLVYCEMAPGDAFFFHSNVLHRSNDNNSDRRRWAYLIAYNTKHNNPVYKHHHPFYTPLQKLANSAILQCENDVDMEGKEFSARDPSRISPYLPRDSE